MQLNAQFVAFVIASVLKLIVSRFSTGGFPLRGAADIVKLFSRGDSGPISFNSFLNFYAVANAS